MGSTKLVTKNLVFLNNSYTENVFFSQMDFFNFHSSDEESFHKITNGTVAFVITFAA